jgi:hypothetical protein
MRSVEADDDQVNRVSSFWDESRDEPKTDAGSVIVWPFYTPQVSSEVAMENFRIEFPFNPAHLGISGTQFS